MPNSVTSGVAKVVVRQQKTALLWPSSTAEALTAVAPLVNHLCVLVGQCSVVWLSKTDCVPVTVPLISPLSWLKVNTLHVTEKKACLSVCQQICSLSVTM